MARVDPVTAADCRPRAVLFDIGETLVERPATGPGRRIATALGLDAAAAASITRLVFTEPFTDPGALAERLRRELSLGQVPAQAVAEVWHAQESEPCEVMGATACVAAVRGVGARVGIVSNIWAPYEAGFRRACPGVVPLVDSWHLSYRAGVAKPDATLLRTALRALEVDPARAAMVGDSLEKDVRPALTLGMRAVWLRRDGERLPPAPVGCDVVRDLDEARAVLLAWLAALPAAASA